MNFKVSKKIEGKWKTFGTVKINKFGHPELGLKMTPELKTLIGGIGDGDWLNLSLFEVKDEPKEEAPKHYDEIPF